MKRKQLLLAIAAMLLPLSMMAQTYHFHEKDGLKYIYQEGDDINDPTKLFIIVNGSLTVDGTSVGNKYFVPDDGLRAAWRYKGDNEATCIKKVDGTTPLGSDRWYKTTWTQSRNSLAHGETMDQRIIKALNISATSRLLP